MKNEDYAYRFVKCFDINGNYIKTIQGSENGYFSVPVNAIDSRGGLSYFTNITQIEYLGKMEDFIK